MTRRVFSSFCAATALDLVAQQPGAATVPPPKKPRVTSSVMLWTLKGSLEEKLELAARAGLQSVELVGEHQSWSDADIRRVKSLARSLRLGMDALSSTPNWKRDGLNMVDPAQRPRLLAEVERHLVFANKLEIPMALLMSGDALPGRTFEEQFESMVAGARQCAELAARYSVTLIVEPLNTKVNHAGYFLSNCVDATRMMRQVDHPNLRLLFDIYHEQVERGDVIKTIETAMPYVRVFHIADAPGRHEPGTGSMQYAPIYAAIAKANYEGVVCMEYLPTKEPSASLSKAVTEMRQSL